MTRVSLKAAKSGGTKASPARRAKAAVASLKRFGTKSVRDGMARYGIPSDKAFGVPMNRIQKLARSLGKDHDLAVALWNTGWYEARLLAAYVDEPERVTPAQMDRWCGDFDNWAVPDTVCFVLFDRTPHAFARIAKWSRRKDEFGKRAAFALLASVALHDKDADDDAFLRCLPLRSLSAPETTTATSSRRASAGHCVRWADAAGSSARRPSRWRRGSRLRRNRPRGGSARTRSRTSAEPRIGKKNRRPEGRRFDRKRIRRGA